MNVWIRSPSRISVPVSVDAIRTVDTIEMVRGVYFAVSSDVPWPDWVPLPGAELRNQPRLHLLGSSGIVYGPATGGRYFTDPAQVEDVFDMYDRPDEGFSVLTQDVMIPTFWIIGSFQPQDVLRVPLTQFHRAYLYTQRLLGTPDLFLEDFDVDLGSVVTSFTEGEVFRQWATNQIGEAIDRYAIKDQELKLKNRDSLPEGWRTHG